AQPTCQRSRRDPRFRCRQRKAIGPGRRSRPCSFGGVYSELSTVLSSIDGLFQGDLSVGKMRIAPVAMPVVAEVNFATSGPLQDTVVLGTTDGSLLFSSDAGKTFDRDKG